MFYNARMYDPALGRFTSADSIIPGGAHPHSGAGGLDRYAYVNNSPVNFTDPSGHVTCTDDGYCGGENNDEYWAGVSKDIQSTYGISFEEKSGQWDQNHILAVLIAVILVGNRVASARNLGETGAEAFRAIFTKGVAFTWDNHCDMCRHGQKQELQNGEWVDSGKACGGDYETHGCVSGGGYTYGENSISFASMSGENNNDMSRMVKNVVHELGHAFYDATGNKEMGESFSRDALLPNSPVRRYDWQQHPPSSGDPANGSELFADTFIAWTYNAWNPLTANNAAVTAAQTAMNGWLP